MSKRTKPPTRRSSDSGDYKVGKGRPPREHCWPPGQSGNKRGRKKGSKNRKTQVRAAERKLFTVIKGGRKKKMSALEIGLDHLHQAIARGELKWLIEYLAILERYSDRDEGVASMQELSDEDAAILAKMLARKKRNNGEP